MTSFLALKDKANQLFKDTHASEGLSLTIYKHRMCQAISLYNRALWSATTSKDRASIWKNMATVQFRIGERMQRSLSATNRATEEKELIYFLQESLKNAEGALVEGSAAHGETWTCQLRDRRRDCATLLWECLVDARHEDVNFQALRGRLHEFCWKFEGQLRAEYFLKYGQLTFHKALSYQENGQFKESMQLLHDNNLAIEEAKKSSEFIDEAEELEEDNYVHLCIGDSAMARERGEALWKSAIRDDEDINMELVWDSIDSYTYSIICSRDKCIEGEAMSHSRLGQLYGSIHMREKSREHFRAVIELESTLRPRSLTHRDWYKVARDGLNKYQQEDLWKENMEKEKIRAPVRAELKDILDELKRVSARSASELIDLIYEKHPPKNGTKSDSPKMKTKLKQALLHYHPDKQDIETHGLKWIVLAEEITVLLTHHFSNWKHD